MLVIIASAVLRLVIYHNSAEIASVLFLSSMFILYLASREYGAGVFKVLIPFVILEALSVIYYGVFNPGEITGGIITSPTDSVYDAHYAIAVGYLTYGAVLLKGKYQWLLVILCLIAMFFVGAAEGVFISGVMGVVVLIRKDWGKKLWLPLLGLVIIAGIWTATGYTEKLYWRTTRSIQAIDDIPVDNNALGIAFSNRFEVYGKAIKELSVLGHGLELTHNTDRTVHNVPFIIIDQLGIAAGISWLVIVIYCLVKTKWRYAWIAVITMGIFGHYTWTQMQPCFWALVGVSTTSLIKNDYIFRSNNEG